MLTAKMSLRRNKITKHYATLVDDIYGGREGFTNTGKGKSPTE
jgi:hypothetical protein